MSSKTLNLVKDLIKSSLCRIVVVPYLRKKSSSISNISELINLAYTFHENLPLPARDLGIGSSDDEGYLQCPDPSKPYICGGTVVFKLKRVSVVKP